MTRTGSVVVLSRSDDDVSGVIQRGGRKKNGCMVKKGRGHKRNDSPH